MSKQIDRKLIKTKFESVFYRIFSKKDPRTGDPDRVYYFWFSDAAGKGHWKAVGRHSQGERPQSARIARAKFLNELSEGNNPAVREKVTVGDAVDAYVTWARAEGKHVDKPLQQYDKHMRARLHSVPINAVTSAMLTHIKADLTNTAAELKYSPKRTTPAPERPLSAQTIAHQFSFLRRVIYRAISCNLWSGSNPFASRKGALSKCPASITIDCAFSRLPRLLHFWQNSCKAVNSCTIWLCSRSRRACAPPKFLNCAHKT